MSCHNWPHPYAYEDATKAAFMRMLDVVRNQEGAYPRNIEVREHVRLDGDWLVYCGPSPSGRIRAEVRISDGEVRLYRSQPSQWVLVDD